MFGSHACQGETVTADISSSASEARYLALATRSIGYQFTILSSEAEQDLVLDEQATPPSQARTIIPIDPTLRTSDRVS